MSKGISIHIGLNRVDPGHYAGWDGVLLACEADASDMREIADSMGYNTSLLLSKEATREAVLSKIKETAKQVVAGDILLVTYAGHGGNTPDFNDDEVDGMDETWCLYDGQLIDDEIYNLWQDFAAGVRILVIPDCCHSGTPTKAAITSAAMSYFDAAKGGGEKRTRNMPLSWALRTFRQNKDFYRQIEEKIPPPKSTTRATVLSLSACQDNQLADDGLINGRFTGTLLAVWNEGKFKGDYKKFHRKIIEKMPPYQTPNLFYFGPDTDGFIARRPFEINPEK